MGLFIKIMEHLEKPNHSIDVYFADGTFEKYTEIKEALKDNDVLIVKQDSFSEDEAVIMNQVIKIIFCTQ